MSEFIGSRISLISRSDIRYVGILHEINSENSTVALEQVVSFGTEGRRGDDKEIPATDNVYEYIVFRGSDVKDLRIEEPAKPQQQKPPQVPDDPAILQSTSRPPTFPQGAPPPQPQQYPAPPMHPYYPQNAQARYGYPPGPYGYAGYPPVGPPGVGQFPPQPPQQQPPQQPPIHQQQQQQPQPIGGFPRQAPPPQAPIGPAANRQLQQQQQQQQQPQQGVPQVGQRTGVPQGQQQVQSVIPKAVEQQAPKPTTPAPAVQPPQITAKGPTAQTSNINIRLEAAQAAGAAQGQEQQAKAAGHAPPGPRGRTGIVPALPLATLAQQGSAPVSNAPAPSRTQAADVSDTSAAVHDLAMKVSQLKTSEAPANGETAEATQRPARQPTNRGRGGFRAGFQQQSRKVEVPATDFDFESANAKFNKQDLIKEVIASEDVVPPVTPTNGSVANGHLEEEDSDTGAAPTTPSDGFYSKTKSFFDNISCENKDRAEAREGERPRGGAAWRGEETKKNIETFGQGSVDGGMGGHRYPGRGGWRGRSRGGYRGYRGRGGASRGGAF